MNLYTGEGYWAQAPDTYLVAPRSGADDYAMDPLRSRLDAEGIRASFVTMPTSFSPPRIQRGLSVAMERSGARIHFVALGRPKHERWIARNRDHGPAVMLGVGATFDFVADSRPRAPGVLQRAGLEWAFQVATEPRRMWRRYAVYNPRFVAPVVRQLLRA